MRKASGNTRHECTNPNTALLLANQCLPESLPVIVRDHHPISGGFSLTILYGLHSGTWGQSETTEKVIQKQRKVNKRHHILKVFFHHALRFIVVFYLREINALPAHESQQSGALPTVRPLFSPMMTGWGRAPA